MKKFGFFLFFIFYILFYSYANVDVSRNKKVFILHSYNLGYIWTSRINDVIFDYFKNDNINFQVEFLDSKFRYEEDDFFEKFYQFYKMKNGDKKFDCVLATDDDAYNFLLHYSDKLFGSQTPVVFCGVNNFDKNDIIDKPNFTGISEIVDIKSTIDLALKIHDRAKHIVFINDLTSTGLTLQNTVNKYVEIYKNKNISFDFVSDVSMEQLAQFCSTLNEETVIILGVFNRDANNVLVTSNEVVRTIQQNCQYPIYSSWDFYLDLGIVGGMITSAQAQAKYAAIYIEKLLNDVPVSSLSVLDKNLNRIFFDYNQLKKYHISLSNVNMPYKIINSKYNFIFEYRTYFLTVFIVIIVLFVIVMLLSVNILKRKYIETKLNESQNDYQTLIQFMNEGFFIQSENNVIEYVNDKFCKMLQLSKDEILGCNIEKFIDKNERKTFFAHIHKRLILDEDMPLEVTFLSKNGHVPTLISPKKKSDKNGRLKGCSCVVTDITEFKRFQNGLAYEKERLYTTLDSIGDGVITTDMNGSIVFCNKVAEEICEWSNREMLHKDISRVYIRFDVQTNKFVDGVIGLISSGKTNNEYMLQTKSGKLINIEETVAAIIDDNNIYHGFVIIFRDIRNRKVIEEEIIKSQKIESLGLLAGGLAHDFNNILSGIIGNLYMAKTFINMNNLNPDELLELITDMEEASERAKKLTTQMLTFAKGGTPICKCIDIKSLIFKSVDFSLAGSNVKSDFIINDNLWHVNADEGQIDQVLNNLIINAKQAMPDGGKIQIIANNIVVTSELGLPLLDGDYVVVKVIDSGAGISPENIKKIYDPYFTTKVKGYGLGLASTYSIIQKHYGYIVCTSQIGVGTTFTFYLPATHEDEPAFIEEQSIIDEQDKNTNSQITILLMDDNDDVRQTNARLLEYFGFVVDTAIDGDEMINLYKSHLDKPYNICILDLVIPGKKNGDKVLADLLTINPNIKSILTSGYSVDPVVADYKKYGFSAVLSKPYRIEELISIIKSLV